MTVAAVILTIAVTIISSCGGGPGQRIKDIEAQKPSPSPTPGEREISGSFSVTGADTSDADPYTGSLTVTPQGNVYSFRWATTKGTRVGTGVQFGSTTAATYAATGGGKGCGVVLYKIASDGSLDGRSALWGEDKFGTEKATRLEGRGFVGKYSSTRTASNGKPYSATLSITKDGSGYDFEWINEDDPSAMGKRLVGFGIWKGSVAAVSFGGRQCSFALYEIQSDGSLKGDWGGQKQVTFGIETAKRQ